MIWNPDIKSYLCESAVASRITKKFDSMYGQFLSNPDDLKEVACAVECFLSRNRNSYVTRTSELVMLTSRALSSIGEKSASRWFFLQGTGLIKFTQWNATGDEAVWMLDVREMTDSHLKNATLMVEKRLKRLKANLVEDNTMNDFYFSIRLLKLSNALEGLDKEKARRLNCDVFKNPTLNLYI